MSLFTPRTHKVVYMHLMGASGMCDIILSLYSLFLSFRYHVRVESFDILVLCVGAYLLHIAKQVCDSLDKEKP